MPAMNGNSTPPPSLTPPTPQPPRPGSSQEFSPTETPISATAALTQLPTAASTEPDPNRTPTPDPDPTPTPEIPETPTGTTNDPENVDHDKQKRHSDAIVHWKGAARRARANSHLSDNSAPAPAEPDPQPSDDEKEKEAHHAAAKLRWKHGLVRQRQREAAEKHRLAGSKSLMGIPQRGILKGTESRARIDENEDSESDKERHARVVQRWKEAARKARATNRTSDTNLKTDDEDDPQPKDKDRQEQQQRPQNQKDCSEIDRWRAYAHQLIERGCAPPPPPPPRFDPDERARQVERWKSYAHQQIERGCAPPPPPPISAEEQRCLMIQRWKSYAHQQIERGCLPPPPPQLSEQQQRCLQIERWRAFAHQQIERGCVPPPPPPPPAPPRRTCSYTPKCTAPTPKRCTPKKKKKKKCKTASTACPISPCPNPYDSLPIHMDNFHRKSHAKERYDNCVPHFSPGETTQRAKECLLKHPPCFKPNPLPCGPLKSQRLTGKHQQACDRGRDHV